MLNLPAVRSKLHYLLDNVVKRASGPGVPLIQIAKTNGKLIDDSRELIIDAVIFRLQQLGLKDLTTETPQELILQYLASPVRFFIKNEPHSKKKFRTCRYRLISNIDLIDLLIEKLLFDGQNKAEIANWTECPSAPGINLSGDAALEGFAGRILRISDNLADAASADITGFDWSVKEWELLMDGRVRARLMGAKPGSWLYRVIMNRIYVLCRPLYVLPDGQLLTQTQPGVQKSGSNNTSSTNSRIRVALAYLVGAKWAVAMGDDCLEQAVENAEDLYAKYGHTLKMYEHCKGYFLFCSMIFNCDAAGLIHPEDGTKTLYRLLEQKELDRPLYEQFQREMRNHPRLSEFNAVIDEVFSPDFTI